MIAVSSLSSVAPDMRVPIQYALTYPDRLPLPSAKRLNLAEIGTVAFSRNGFGTVSLFEICL